MLRCRAFILGTHTTYDRRTTAFEGLRIKGQGHMQQTVVKHDTCTDLTVSGRTVKRGTHTSYDKRTTLIDFQGQWSKVKV